MEKFKVEVKVVKYDTYEVEVEAEDSDAAGDAACRMWRENVSEFFQVDKPDGWEVLECERLTWHCHKCGAPMSEAQWRYLDNEMCATCDAAALQEEIDYWNATPARIRRNAWRIITHAVAAGREVFDPHTRKQWRVTRMAASPIST